MTAPSFSVVYCALTGRMRVLEGAPEAVRAVADEWARSVPGHPVHVLASAYAVQLDSPTVDDPVTQT